MKLWVVCGVGTLFAICSAQAAKVTPVFVEEHKQLFDQFLRRVGQELHREKGIPPRYHRYRIGISYQYGVDDTGQMFLDPFFKEQGYATRRDMPEPASVSCGLVNTLLERRDTMLKEGEAIYDNILCKRLVDAAHENMLEAFDLPEPLTIDEMACYVNNGPLEERERDLYFSHVASTLFAFYMRFHQLDKPTFDEMVS